MDTVSSVRAGTVGGAFCFGYCSRSLSVSDQFEQTLEAPPGQVRSEVRFQVGVRNSPVEVAEMRYIREHGATGFDHAIEVLIYNLSPPSSVG